MRTTLEIEDDLLQAAEKLAQREGVTVGQIISRLTRKGLEELSAETLLVRNGVPILPSRGEAITLERVQQIIDAEGV